MRVLLVLCLAAVVLCDKFYAFHYNGELKVNNGTSTAVAGPVFIEFLKTVNMTVIAGMHVNGPTKVPYGFGFKINSYNVSGDRFMIIAACAEGAWGTTQLKKMNGTIVLYGNIGSYVGFYGWCSSNTTHAKYSILGQGNATRTGYYNATEAARRAAMLVGQAGHTYKPVHVLNFAIVGYPYIGSIKSCEWYLKNMNQTSNVTAGYVIVGKDGKHCGVVDAEGDKFVHTNPTTKKVALTPLVKASEFFPKGYVFKSY